MAAKDRRRRPQKLGATSTTTPGGDLVDTAGRRLGAGVGTRQRRIA